VHEHNGDSLSDDLDVELAGLDDDPLLRHLASSHNHLYIL
jgi:hypothetical protein